MFFYYHYYIYRNSLFYHRNVNSFLLYCILFYFNSCMYGGRAPKGELCNKVCMYVCMYFPSILNCGILVSLISLVLRCQWITYTLCFFQISFPQCRVKIYSFTAHAVRLRMRHPDYEE